MAQEQPDYTIDYLESQRYAVGFTDVTQSEENLLQTALYAHSEGFNILLASPELETDNIDQLRQLRATVIECSSGKNTQDLLVDTASKHGYSGIVVCDPNDQPDLEAARQQLRSSSDFALEAKSFEGHKQQRGRLIGIPAYNESVGIGSVILTAQQYADEVVVIDDGSSDNTVNIARQTGATVLEHETNKGKGRALQTFFKYARTSEYDSFVVLDGDGQHLPQDIPVVAEAVETGEADLVVGSRYLEDANKDETPLHRRFGQQVLDYLTFGSSGTKLTDTQSGFRAFSPAAIDELSIRTDGMGVESEMIASAQDTDLTIQEVPIDVRYEGVDGQTLNSIYHGLGVATFLLQLIRDRHPLLVFGGPGFVIAGAGVLFGIDAVLMYNTQGVFAPGQTMVSLLLTIIGLLGVFCGLILNRMSNMIAELAEESG